MIRDNWYELYICQLLLDHYVQETKGWGQFEQRSSMPYMYEHAGHATELGLDKIIEHNILRLEECNYNRQK